MILDKRWSNPYISEKHYWDDSRGLKALHQKLVLNTVAWHKWVPKMTYVIALSSSLFTVKLRVNCIRKNNLPWHTVNLYGPDCWLEYFFYFIHSQCSVPEADNKISLFFFFASIFSIFHLRHAIYRILAALFSDDFKYIICLLFPVILANFGHDKPVLRIEKSLFSPLGIKCLPFWTMLTCRRRFTLSIPGFS